MAKDSRTKIIRYIQDYLRDNQIPPSLREIQKHCGFSAIGTVQYHMKNLQKSGHLDIIPSLSRGIRLTARATGIPIIGRVPAGPAQLAFEDIEGYLDNLHQDPAPAPATIVEPHPTRAASRAPSNTTDERGLFALRVKGDSMIQAGIFDGDLVVVRPQASGKNNDIVVARIGHEDATVKRLVRKPGVLELAPANPRYRPIPIDEHTEILGKVIRVVRSYN